jgi:hypothetical protein
MGFGASVWIGPWFGPCAWPACWPRVIQPGLSAEFEVGSLVRHIGRTGVHMKGVIGSRLQMYIGSCHAEYIKRWGFDSAQA